jgi:hypothetical protein
MNFNFNINKISSQINPLFVYLQKQKENQKLVKLLEIGGTFVLISFFAFFAIKPTVLTISLLLGDIKSKELLNQELKTKINDVIAAQDLYSQVQEKYSLIESSLPVNPHFFQATTQVLASSQKQQLFLNKVDYLVSEPNYFSTSISTSSSFLSAITIVSDLLQNRRLIDLDNISFSLDKNILNQKIYLNLPIKIYYWPKDAKE